MAATAELDLAGGHRCHQAKPAQGVQRDGVREHGSVAAGLEGTGQVTEEWPETAAQGQPAVGFELDHLERLLASRGDGADLHIPCAHRDRTSVELTGRGDRVVPSRLCC